MAAAPLLLIPPAPLVANPALAAVMPVAPMGVHDIDGNMIADWTAFANFVAIRQAEDQPIATNLEKVAVRNFVEELRYLRGGSLSIHQCCLN